MPFPLLDLPPEIREKIYLFTLVSPNPVPLTADSISLASLFASIPTPNPLNERLHSLFPHALLLTCHQVYDEVRLLYFAHNNFSLFLVRHSSPMSYFISPAFQDNRRRIKALKLVISRWGGHDFFLRGLTPVLEDMILNGSLRDLEVIARRTHLFSIWRDDRMVARKSGSVERLFAILRDPYLERAVLRVTVKDDILGLNHLGVKDESRGLTNATLDVTRYLSDSEGSIKEFTVAR